MVSNQSNKRVLQWIIVFINHSRILYGWTKEQKFYYGVRYKRGCHPNDLWTTYFTSSKVVQQHRKEFGEPDVIEVRRTFLWQGDAREWEHKVLRRLDVQHNDKWLNKSTGKTPYCTGEQHPLYGKSPSEETRKKRSASQKGKKHTEETKMKMSDAHRGKILSSETKKKLSDAHRGKKHSEEHRKKLSDSNRGKKHTEETRKKLSDSNRGKKHTEESKRKMSEARRGKKLSIGHKQKISASTRGENNPNYGKSPSEETRKKMSDSKKGRNKGKITCLDIEERIFVNITTVLYQQNRDRYFPTGSKVYREYKLTASQEAQTENN